MFLSDAYHHDAKFVKKLETCKQMAMNSTHVWIFGHGLSQTDQNNATPILDGKKLYLSVSTTHFITTTNLTKETKTHIIRLVGIALELVRFACKESVHSE